MALRRGVMTEFLAIDIGASSGRHILGREINGKLVLEEIYRFSNSPLEAGNRLVWNAERLFAEILTGLKRAKEIGRIPRYVGIDTWAVDYALIDGDGKMIDDVVSYRDGRTARVIEKVHERVPFETLYEKTGIQFQPFNTVYQLYEDKDSGRLEKAKYMLMLPDYLHYRLTGKMSREYTNATSTGLVNARLRDWDSDIIRALDLPEELFPETQASGTKLGAFSKEIENIVGYSAEIILPATHDTASAVIAAPFGGLYLSSGTWSLLGAEMKQPYTDEKSRRYNYSNEGSLDGVRLQKNIMGLWMIQQIRRETNDAYSFAQLADMARRSANDYLVDVNDNRFLAPANMRAEIEAAVGRSLDTGEIAYCIFSSLAKGYAQAVEEFETITKKKYDSLNIIGGGSKNELLNELTARATGKHIYTGPTEATAIGNLAVQMVSAGVFDGIASARKVIKNSFEIGEIL